MAIFDRGNLKVQGDGRPFSLLRINRLAILHRSDVLPLVEAVETDARRAAALTHQITAILCKYLVPLILAKKLADHATSLKLLAAIARDSAKLAEQLSRLDQDFLLAIEELRAEPFDEIEPPHFDILPLTRKLARLGHAAHRVRASTAAKSMGAPAKHHLDVAVGLLLGEIEGGGLSVVLSNSGSRATRRRLDGSGGLLLVAIFGKFDPHTDEPRIWGSVDRVRRAAMHAKAVKGSPPS